MFCVLFLIFITKNCPLRNSEVKLFVSMTGERDGSSISSVRESTFLWPDHQRTLLLGFDRLVTLLKSISFLGAHTITTIISVGKLSSCFWLEAPLHLWDDYFGCYSEIPWRVSSFPYGVWALTLSNFYDILFNDLKSRAFFIFLI